MLASFALALLLAGCATQEPVGRVRGGAPNAAAPIRLELGPVGVISPPTPAEFGFDKAEGRIESAVDAAGHAAELMLETPTFTDPALEMAAGGVRFALGPLAAVAGALSSGHSKMPPHRLSASESDLAQAMASVANQLRFREFVLQAAGQKIPGRLVPIDSTERPSPGAPPLSAILETRTEELRLEGDDAYTTPPVIDHHGKEALLVWGAEHVTAHDPSDSRLVWSCGGFNPQAVTNWPAVASPVIARDVVVVAGGRADIGRPRLYGIRLGGTGDVTTTHRL